MRNTAFVAGALLLVPAILLAQAEGRIKGTVTDATGKPIQGATITMTCADIANFHRQVAADERGNWATIVVDATRQYKFHVEAPGFQAAEEVRKPMPGQTFQLDFKLHSLAELRAAAQQKALEEPGIKELREGRDLLDAGKVADARAKFAEAVAAKPGLYAAWEALGDIDQKAGKNDDALAAVEKCLAIKPDFPQCLAVGMNAARAKKDTALYEKYATAYRNTNPSDPVVYFNEAVPLINKGDFAAARPILEKALEADPNYPEALYNLGVACASLGDYAKAKESLEKFLAVAPKHKDADSARAMLDWVKTQTK
jgi:tetratricopeptide (TPR) repeat protein